MISFRRVLYFSVIFVLMGRLNILIFLVVLTISGFVTGDRLSRNKSTACLPHHSIRYRPYIGLNRNTKPLVESCKTYKTRFRASEIEFEPAIFKIVFYTRVHCCKPNHLQTFYFIPYDWYDTVSLRGPPSVC